eukprot:TRINITY_DN23678_c0_g2_i1.p1 TRINITY_DN23678_c0_g2~~TRINITY_DN23678_c0_g2_i1.p1  ORF type:complete len:949 (-),score=134.63 TRINITY_DN23678_c0_g2_i1:297-3143(-)
MRCRSLSDDSRQRFPSACAEQTEYIVDTRRVNPTGEISLPYCFAKSLESKEGGNAPSGSIVHGVDEGDGWLKIGHSYLPTRLYGWPVVKSLVPCTDPSFVFDAARLAGEEAVASGEDVWEVAEQAANAAWNAGGSQPDIAQAAGRAAAEAARIYGASLEDVARAAADCARQAGGSQLDIIRAAGDAAAQDAASLGLSATETAEAVADAAMAAGASPAEVAIAAGISPVEVAKSVTDAIKTDGGSPHLVTRFACAAAEQAARAAERLGKSRGSITPRSLEYVSEQCSGMITSSSSAAGFSLTHGDQVVEEPADASNGNAEQVLARPVSLDSLSLAGQGDFTSLESSERNAKRFDLSAARVLPIPLASPTSRSFGTQGCFTPAQSRLKNNLLRNTKAKSRKVSGSSWSPPRQKLSFIGASRRHSEQISSASALLSCASIAQSRCGEVARGEDAPVTTAVCGSISCGSAVASCSNVVASDSVTSVAHSRVDGGEDLPSRMHSLQACEDAGCSSSSAVAVKSLARSKLREAMERMSEMMLRQCGTLELIIDAFKTWEQQVQESRVRAVEILTVKLQRQLHALRTASHELREIQSNDLLRRMDSVEAVRQGRISDLRNEVQRWDVLTKRVCEVQATLKTEQVPSLHHEKERIAAEEVLARLKSERCFALWRLYGPLDSRRCAWQAWRNACETWQLEAESMQYALLRSRASCERRRSERRHLSGCVAHETCVVVFSAWERTRSKTHIGMVYKQVRWLQKAERETREVATQASRRGYEEALRALATAQICLLSTASEKLRRLYCPRGTLYVYWSEWRTLCEHRASQAVRPRPPSGIFWESATQKPIFSSMGTQTESLSQTIMPTGSSPMVPAGAEHATQLGSEAYLRSRKELPCRSDENPSGSSGADTGIKIPLKGNKKKGAQMVRTLPRIIFVVLLGILGTILATRVMANIGNK